MEIRSSTERSSWPSSAGMALLDGIDLLLSSSLITSLATWSTRHCYYVAFFFILVPFSAPELMMGAPAGRGGR